MRDYNRKIQKVYQRLINLTRKDIQGRMACALICLVEVVYCADSVELHLTKQELADISGMSKDRRMKILREFQNEGIILLDNHQLHFLNPSRLRMISNLG